MQPRGLEKVWCHFDFVFPAAGLDDRVCGCLTPETPPSSELEAGFQPITLGIWKSCWEPTLQTALEPRRHPIQKHPIISLSRHPDQSDPSEGDPTWEDINTEKLLKGLLLPFPHRNLGQDTIRHIVNCCGPSKWGGPGIRVCVSGYGSREHLNQSLE